MKTLKERVAGTLLGIQTLVVVGADVAAGAVVAETVDIDNAGLVVDCYN